MFTYVNALEYLISYKFLLTTLYKEGKFVEGVGSSFALSDLINIDRFVGKLLERKK